MTTHSTEKHQISSVEVSHLRIVPICLYAEESLNRNWCISMIESEHQVFWFLLCLLLFTLHSLILVLLIFLETLSILTHEYIIENLILPFILK